MDLFVMPWKPDADVHGEAAGLSCDDRILDLIVTYCANKTFAWEVVDDDRVEWCIASGTATSAADARRNAETAGRRAFVRIAA